MFRGLLDHMPGPSAPKSSGCVGCRAKALTSFNKQGMKACQAGDLEEAADLLKQGVALAEQFGVDMFEAKLRNNLGLVLVLMRREEAAVGEFEKAMRLVDARLGRDNALYRRIAKQRAELLGDGAEYAAVEAGAPPVAASALVAEPVLVAP